MMVGVAVGWALAGELSDGQRRVMEVEILFPARPLEFADGSARILVDPFLAPHNPAAPTSAADVDPTTSCSPTGTRPPRRDG